MKKELLGYCSLEGEETMRAVSAAVLGSALFTLAVIGISGLMEKENPAEMLAEVDLFCAAAIMVEVLMVLLAVSSLCSVEFSLYVSSGMTRRQAFLGALLVGAAASAVGGATLWLLEFVWKVTFMADGGTPLLEMLPLWAVGALLVMPVASGALGGGLMMRFGSKIIYLPVAAGLLLGLTGGLLDGLQIKLPTEKLLSLAAWGWPLCAAVMVALAWKLVRRADVKV